MSELKYDIFLSHNSKDKPDVEQLAERLLEDYGIRSWMDKWALVASEDWEPELQRVLNSCETCAVILGERGWGEYHLKEAKAALERQKQSPAFRVIPVTLPKASAQDMQVLGDFFGRAQRVNFDDGVGDEEAYQSFVAAVRGKPPGPPLMSLYRLLRDAERWEQSPPKDKSKLYRGRTLQEAQKIAQQNPGQLSELAVKFLSLSAVTEQRSTRRRYFILVAVLVVVAALGVLAWWQRGQAIYQAKVALARQLAAQAEMTRDQQAELLPRSVLLAIEAVRRFPSLETEQALRREVDLLPRLAGGIDVGDAASAVAFSPDGQYLAAATDDHVLRIRRMGDGVEVTRAQLKADVHTVSYSLDGRYLVTAGPDDLAQVFEAGTGREVSSINLPGLTSAALSPDGKYVATSDSEKTAQVRETSGGRVLSTFRHDHVVNAVAFSPDGRFLASASDDHTARVWELGVRREVARLPYPEDVACIAFSPDGRYLAAASNDTVQVWNAAKFEAVTHIVSDSPVWNISFSQNGRLLAVAGASKVVRVWVVRSGREVARMLHEKNVEALGFSTDGRYLATAGNEGRASLWDSAGGHEVTRMFHDGHVWATNFSPDGKYILTAGDDNTARLWEADGGREAARFTHERSVGSASYSPKANYIITSSLDTYANSFTRLFRVGDRQEIIDFTPDGPAKSAVFSPDERLLATAAGDGTVRVWEVEGRRRLAQMRHEGLTVFAFSSGGAHLVTADDGRGIQIWSVDGGQRVGLWAREDLGKPVGFSPDGRYLATLSEDHTVRLTETSGGREAARMKHEDDVDHIVFSRDGEYVATVSTFEKTARVWRAADGRLVGRPLIHGDLFDIIVFSHDGRHAATAGQDKIIRVWEVELGREVVRLLHDDRVTSVSFSPDGQYLAAGGADGMARIWRLRAEDLIDAACGRLTRNLTREEWTQYLGDDAYSKTCDNLP